MEFGSYPVSQTAGGISYYDPHSRPNPEGLIPHCFICHKKDHWTLDCFSYHEHFKQQNNLDHQQTSQPPLRYDQPSSSEEHSTENRVTSSQGSLPSLNSHTSLPEKVELYPEVRLANLVGTLAEMFKAYTEKNDQVLEQHVQRIKALEQDKINKDKIIEEQDERIEELEETMEYMKHHLKFYHDKCETDYKVLSQRFQFYIDDLTEKWNYTDNFMFLQFREKWFNKKPDESDDEEFWNQPCISSDFFPTDEQKAISGNEARSTVSDDLSCTKEEEALPSSDMPHLEEQMLKKEELLRIERNLIKRDQDGNQWVELEDLCALDNDTWRSLATPFSTEKEHVQDPVTESKESSPEVSTLELPCQMDLSGDMMDDDIAGNLIWMLSELFFDGKSKMEQFSKSDGQNVEEKEEEEIVVGIECDNQRCPNSGNLSLETTQTTTERDSSCTSDAIASGSGGMHNKFQLRACVNLIKAQPSLKEVKDHEIRTMNSRRKRKLKRQWVPIGMFDLKELLKAGIHGEQSANMFMPDWKKKKRRIPTVCDTCD